MQKDDFCLAEKLFDEGRHAEALRLYTELAKAGSVEAQVFLGWMYDAGKGTERNPEVATQWFQLAAQAGSAEAEYHLGKIRNRQGQYQAALEHFQSAASRNYGAAFFRLGRAYETGRGVSTDVNRAFLNYQKASAQGHIFGLKCLALMLLKGKRGILGRVEGGLLFLKAIVITVVLGFRDPHSDKLKE